MKICFLMTRFPQKKGTSKAIYYEHLAYYLKNKGLQIGVVTPSDADADDFENRDGIRIFRFRYWFKRYQALAYRSGIMPNLKENYLLGFQLPFFLLFFLIKSLYVCRDYDIIQAHTTPVAFLALILKPFLRKPVITVVEGTDARTFPRFSQFVVNRSDAACAPGVDKSVERMSNIRIIPTPVNTEMFNPNCISDDALKKEFMLRDEFIVTFIGRLYEFKNPLLFVKTMPYIINRIQNIRFIIVGEGAQYMRVKSMVKRSGLEEYVILTGKFRSDINAILKLSDVYVSIENDNVWANTIAESMAMETPCIISDSENSSKFFTHMKNCYIVKHNDPQSIADGIVSMLEDPGMRSQISAGGSSFLRAQKKLPEDVVSLHMSMYEDVTGMR
ncbi:glycosyltransferase family 4 protein [Elusimicrobiota bacterium]